MAESSFTVLREIGTITLSPNEEIRFSIDVYRGFRYVSVRRFLQLNGLFAPTRDGLTLTPEIIRLLEPKVVALPDEPKQIENVQLGKFAKRQGICIVAGIGTLKNQRGLVLRQWQEDIGWTKKGIWLPLDKIKEIKMLFKQTRQALDEQPIDDF